MNSTSNTFSSIGRSLAVALIIVATSATTHAQSVAYTGATIETMGKSGRIENATMVVADGKITDIGNDIEIPDDARLVSLSGRTIMPGIVDPYHVFKSTAPNNSRTVVFRGRTFVIPGGGPFSAGPFIPSR